MTDSSKSALSLISTHQGYSESEQRIVDYILEHQSEAPRLTAAQLSRAAATSEATVSRFCRKLGVCVLLRSIVDLPASGVCVGRGYAEIRDIARRSCVRASLLHNGV